MAAHQAIHCPSCLKPGKLPPSAQGRQITCNRCGHSFVVGQDGDGPNPKGGSWLPWLFDDYPFWWLVFLGLPMIGLLAVAWAKTRLAYPHLSKVPVVLAWAVFLFLVLTLAVRLLRVVLQIGSEASDYERMHEEGVFYKERGEVDAEGASATSWVSKSCSNCGKDVPSDAKAGEHCPHCRARWSYETKR